MYVYQQLFVFGVDFKSFKTEKYWPVHSLTKHALVSQLSMLMVAKDS